MYDDFAKYMVIVKDADRLYSYRYFYLFISLLNTIIR